MTERYKCPDGSLEIVVFDNGVKKIKRTMLVRSKMLASRTGNLGIPCPVRTAAAVFFFIRTAVLCHVAIGLFICTHSVTSVSAVYTA